MGNTQSKFKRKSNKLKVVKRYIKFLAVAPVGGRKSRNQKSSERGNRRHLQRGAQRPPGRCSHPTTPDTSLSAT